MSFIDRAKAEAEEYSKPKMRPVQSMREHMEEAFINGAVWAVEQEPTDQEIEAAGKFLYDTYTALVPNAWEQEDEEERNLWRNDARRALLAAREARKA